MNSSYWIVLPIISLLFLQGEDRLVNPKNCKAQITLADTFPLTELGLDLWKTYSGGLYPMGMNTRPVEHEKAGQDIARSIAPVDSFGKQDLSNGRIVLLSIGMSNATQEFSVFKMMADTFKLKNSKLTIVDGAQGGQTASVIKDPNANFWNVVNQRLTQQRVNSKQVQIVWLKEANANPNMPFPKHASDLKLDLKSIVIILKQKFPNLKSIYLSSRTYGGYANTPLNPEPYAYETGFSVKWLIEDQINKDTALSFDSNKPRTAWLSWGPYLWAQGSKPRSDGFFWTRDDFAQDGTHPSNTGRQKVARLLLNFFSTDSTCFPWFLKSNITVSKENKMENNSISIQSNSYESILIWKNVDTKDLQLHLYSSGGKLIVKEKMPPSPNGEGSFLISHNKLIPGIYYILLNNGKGRVSKKFIVL